MLLEKHADVMIADHAKPLHAPAGSVSFKYIDVSVAQGALANIEEHRIRPLNAPRPAASTRQTRVPFSPLDKQILLTWVRRAPSDTRGNEIYKKLEELVRRPEDRLPTVSQFTYAFQYPHHSWHSWRDKWVKNMSLLSEDQLPAILQELPPSKAQRAGGVQTTPAAAAPSTKPAPSIKPASSTRPAPSPTPTPASSNRYPRAVSEVDPQRARTRVRFTKEDDRILAKYVKKRIREGEKPRGNKIYDDLAKIVSSGPSASSIQLLTVASTHTTPTSRGATGGYDTSQRGHLSIRQMIPSPRQSLPSHDPNRHQPPGRRLTHLIHLDRHSQATSANHKHRRQYSQRRLQRRAPVPG